MDDRDGAGLHRHARQRPALGIDRRRPQTALGCRTSGEGGRPRPTPARRSLTGAAAWSGTSTTATSSWTSSRARSCSASPGWEPRARTTFCGPRSGHWCSTYRPAHPSMFASRDSSSFTSSYRSEYAAYYRRHATSESPADAGGGPSHRPGAGHRDVLLRQGQADCTGDRRVLRQRHQRHARGRSSLDLFADRREQRSSGSSIGPSRRRNCSASPSPGAMPAV